MRTLSAGIAVVFLSACTVFTPPSERPIIKHEVGIGWGDNRFETLAATADRRVILVSPARDRACAEPSPDALVSLASSVGASLGASKADVAELQTAFARGLAVNTSPIAHRTQGLAFYRDMAFQACQLWMNDVVDQAKYMTMLQEAATLAAPLIAQEVALLPQLFGDKHQGAEAATAPTLSYPPPAAEKPAIPPTPEPSESSEPTDDAPTPQAPPEQ
ncbi:hypothetical protein [Chiayiivirga flava]|uniref:Lipoprotein n=1 Tax=Chiayiivirga flava TaxID=659595 RepID=A0A7W8D5N0_9GAMM|nr:hypothetical protein [Chiayiivirga flava]MBB5208376.1 hypothetical protein [Chiayiivirga flava]